MLVLLSTTPILWATILLYGLMQQETTIYLGTSYGQKYYVEIIWESENEEEYWGKVRYNKAEETCQILSIHKHQDDSHATFDKLYNAEPPETIKFLRNPRQTIQKIDKKWREYAKEEEEG
jgi:hypothetical protein